MRWKSIFVPLLFLFMMGAASRLAAQVTYSAREGQLPLSVGFGLAEIWDDWGVQHPHQLGLTLWVDYRLPHMPPALRGLGIEVEARDVNYATPSFLPGHRMDTALGGPIFQFRRDRRIRPFAKALIGLGSIDFPNPSTYQHDTRTVFAPGAGADVRIVGRLSARGEYEYQIWPQLFGPNSLTPQGFTFGVVYDIGRLQQ